MTWVSVAICLGILALISLVVLTVRADIQTREADSDKGTKFDALAEDVREINVVSTALALYHIKDDPALRGNLIAALNKANVVCDHCPLQFSIICDDCGRQTIENAKKEGC